MICSMANKFYFKNSFDMIFCIKLNFVFIPSFYNQFCESIKLALFEGMHINILWLI